MNIFNKQNLGLMPSNPFQTRLDRFNTIPVFSPLSITQNHFLIKHERRGSLEYDIP